jgi:peroxiredoxin|tara:strand:- start:372 stop:812 length:441 start_codon:yes stop_codon:yes gene_type:complete
MSNHINDMKVGKVVVFGLPGAFTPTCSSTHLPGYEEKYDQIIEAGAREVYCVSVNDSFVMDAWAKDLGISKVKMVPDGNLEFTDKMNMRVSKSNIGFGDRSWRYSVVLQDGVITKLFEEEGKANNFEGDPFKVSGADNMLSFLKGE